MNEVENIRAALQQTPRRIDSKYFYDARGSDLFEAICATEEYYLTRADLDLTQRHAQTIAKGIARGTRLIELGSGAGIKIRLLLQALEGRLESYVPIDISRSALDAATTALAKDYPKLRIQPVCADYTAALALPRSDASHTAVYFPGSTIGNFPPEDAAKLLGQLRLLCGPDGQILLVVDRHKDSQVLEAAYNDKAGVTAAFNLNILEHLNREHDANFEVTSFRHRAIYRQQQQRIEMHLVSQERQRVAIGGHSIELQAGETILTEVSYKYDERMLTEVARAAGLGVDAVWTDSKAQVMLARLLPN
jgi:dimethylhistidine N-methyltransferase